MQMTLRSLRLGLVLVACGGDTITQNNTTFTTINNISQSVGASGAVVTSPSGAQATIPAGALATEVTVSIAEVPTDALGRALPTFPAGETLASAIFAFEPHGQIFALDVTLAIPHNGMGGKLYRLAASGEGGSAMPLGAWTEISVLQNDPNRMLATTRGFSFFAVAGGSGMSGEDTSCDTPEVAQALSEWQQLASAIDQAVRCNPAENLCTTDTFQGFFPEEVPLTACYVMNAGFTSEQLTGDFFRFLEFYRNLSPQQQSMCIPRDPNCSVDGCAPCPQTLSPSCQPAGDLFVCSTSAP